MLLGHNYSSFRRKKKTTQIPALYKTKAAEAKHKAEAVRSYFLQHHNPVGRKKSSGFMANIKHMKKIRLQENIF